MLLLRNPQEGNNAKKKVSIVAYIIGNGLHFHWVHFILPPKPIHFSIFLPFFPAVTSTTPYYNPFYLHIKLPDASGCFSTSTCGLRDFSCQAFIKFTFVPFMKSKEARRDDIRKWWKGKGRGAENRSGTAGIAISWWLIHGSRESGFRRPQIYN